MLGMYVYMCTCVHCAYVHLCVCVCMHIHSRLVAVTCISNLWLHSFQRIWAWACLHNDAGGYAGDSIGERCPDEGDDDDDDDSGDDDDDGDHGDADDADDDDDKASGSSTKADGIVMKARWNDLSYLGRVGWPGFEPFSFRICMFWFATWFFCWYPSIGFRDIQYLPFTAFHSLRLKAYVFRVEDESNLRQNRTHVDLQS